MRAKPAILALTALALALSAPAFAEPAFAKGGDSNERSPVGQAVDGVKEGGRAIGHGARDATTAIGHGTRDAVHAVGDTCGDGVFRSRFLRVVLEQQHRAPSTVFTPKGQPNLRRTWPQGHVKGGNK